MILSDENESTLPPAFLLSLSLSGTNISGGGVFGNGMRGLDDHSAECFVLTCTCRVSDKKHTQKVLRDNYSRSNNEGNLLERRE